MVFSLVVACLIASSEQTANARWELQDSFGRDLAQKGITLVDWEGHIANPAIKLQIQPAGNFYAPARVTITANGGRLMFNLHSEFGPDGPSKTLFIPKSDEPVEFWMSIAPDRDGQDEVYELTIEVSDANMLMMKQVVPVRVIDQDRDRPLDFKVTSDFSYDKTGFFDSELIKKISQTAADDWSYFLAEQGFDEVAAGSEKSWIWEPTGFIEGRDITNKDAYTGFKLYFHGINHEEGRAGAEASRQGDEQTRNGVKTGLRRSGSVMMDTTGNWNHKGWTINLDDDAWHKSTNMSYELHDYYSIVRHEMNHSFVYHRVIRAFDEMTDGKTFIDDKVRAYLGFDPDLLDVEHFGGINDPVSKQGVMGNEYGGDMPRGRWFLTKFDMVVAESVGYRLRETTPFMPLEVVEKRVAISETVGLKISQKIHASDGVPTYDFSVEVGELPAGVTLNRWTGEISGVPENSGSFNARIAVRDNDSTTPSIYVDVSFTIHS